MTLQLATTMSSYSSLYVVMALVAGPIATCVSRVQLRQDNGDSVE